MHIILRILSAYLLSLSVILVCSFWTHMQNDTENQCVLTFYLQSNKNLVAENCRRSVEPSGWSEVRKQTEGVGW